MNAAIVQRLVWKEYRFLRSFWVAALVLAGCAAIVWRGLASWYERPVQLEDFLVIAAVVTSLFALGVGGTAFATEHEVGTAEFLRRLPLDGRNLVAGKLLLSAVGLIGLKLVLWTVVGVFAFWLPVAAERLRLIGWCSAVCELELLGWGMLFSLVTRQPLMAITWGMIAETAVVHLVPAMSRTENAHPQSFLLHDYSFALPGRAVFGLALLASVVWLSTTWIRSPQPLSVIPDWLRRLSTGRRAASSNWLSGTAALPLSDRAKGQLARLIWLQWRQSWLLWASLFIPFVASGLWLLMTLPWTHDSENVSFLFAISTGLLWLGLGISVFHGQQAHFRFRYFSEHGVAPARVWWGHQLSALIPLTVSLFLFLVGIVVANPPSTWNTQAALGMSSLLLFGSSLVFSIGQLVGMLARQILVAGAMGLIGLLMHFGWMLLLQEVSTPPVTTFWVILGLIFGFVPLMLAWFWATRQHVSSWILERRSWQTRRRLVLCLVGPWLLMAVAVMSFRVLEIPNAGVEPPTREQLLTLSPEERQTAEMYQSVSESLGINATPIVERTFPNSSSDVIEQQFHKIEERIQQSPEIMDRILAATRRPIGAFDGEPEQQNAVAYLLVRLLTRATNQAFESKSIDRAIELFDAQRRLLIHWRRNTDFVGINHSDYIENGDNGLLQQLMRELRAHPWQAEQYQELARRIAEVNALDQPDFQRAWGREYRDAIDCLNGGDWPKYLTADRKLALSKSGWLLLIPGEKARATRLLKAWYAAANSHHDSLFIPRSSADVTNEESWSSSEKMWFLIAQMSRSNFAWNTPWARWLNEHVEEQGRLRWRYADLSSRWQALQAWLQLRAMQLENGKLPTSSDGVAGIGPVTPQRSQAFGWIAYLPTGLSGSFASEPLNVVRLDRSLSRLNGNEPCVLLARTQRTLEAVLKRLPEADDSKEREVLLMQLVVEPLGIFSPARE